MGSDVDDEKYDYEKYLDFRLSMLEAAVIAKVLIDANEKALADIVMIQINANRDKPAPITLEFMKGRK
jgi:hypothetical protein